MLLLHSRATIRGCTITTCPLNQERWFFAYDTCLATATWLVQKHVSTILIGGNVLFQKDKINRAYHALHAVSSVFHVTLDAVHSVLVERLQQRGDLAIHPPERLAAWQDDIRQHAGPGNQCHSAQRLVRILRMAHEVLDARTRLQCTLEGLATGDAFGERVFQAGTEYHQSLAAQPGVPHYVPMGRWEYTDDTQMALSIAEVLCTHQIINQDALAQSFGQRFERQRGYGPAMYQLLPQLRAGATWQPAASALFGGRGSYGNGAAMRVAPVGAYFADNIDLVVEQARRSAVVTHTHPEAVAGAIAIAVATAYAWRLRATLSYNMLLSLVIPHVPESDVKQRIERVAQFPADATIWEVIKAVGNGSGIMAQIRCRILCDVRHDRCITTSRRCGIRPVDLVTLIPIVRLLVALWLV